MSLKFFFPLLLAVSVASVILASQPATEDLGDAEPFLVPGNSYVIHFPKGVAPFVRSWVDPAPVATVNGSVVPAKAGVSYSHQLSIFRVVRQRDASWVLVEYPNDPENYLSWGGKHRAAYRLRHPKKLMAEMNDEQRANIKTAAARAVPVKRSWLNIGQAITIEELSVDSLWGP